MVIRERRCDDQTAGIGDTARQVLREREIIAQPEVWPVLLGVMTFLGRAETVLQEGDARPDGVRCSRRTTGVGCGPPDLKVGPTLR